MVGDGSHKIPMVIAKEPLEIKQYIWGCSYQPYAYAEISYQENEGFLIYMRCYETEIRTENTEENSNVYEDSCMEFFVNFYPKESKNYINFEVNAKGAMLCAFGSDRQNRTFIKELGIKHPVVKTAITKEYWEISYTVELSLIESLYHHSDFPEHHIICANFYKCGDKTKQPHYGSWMPIKSEKPDFHRPDYFGELAIN